MRYINPRFTYLLTYLTANVLARLKYVSDQIPPWLFDGYCHKTTLDIDYPVHAISTPHSNFHVTRVLRTTERV